MKYLFVFFNSFKRSLVYRFDVFFSLILVIILALFSKFFWTAFANAGKIPVSELGKYITYSVIASALSSIFMSELIVSISEKIRWGTITSELQKPVDFQLLSVAESFGNMTGRLLIKFIPIIVLLKLMINISIPGSPFTLVLFFFSALFGYCILVAFDYIVSLLAFYYVEVWAFQTIKNNIIGFCSGAYLPLWLFPAPVLKVFDFLPFKYYIFVPLNIYLGELKDFAVFRSMAEQLAWILILFAAGKLLTRFAVKNLTVAGG